MDLDYEKVEKIVSFCKDKIGFSFGIGTDFTNDVGLKRMNIVLKMTEAYPDGRTMDPGYQTIRRAVETYRRSGRN